MPTADATSSAFELFGAIDRPGSFVFTCEHARNHLPPDISPSDSDRELLEQHWGWDIGAENVSRRFVAGLGGQAVLGGYSRLVIDLNRDPRSPDLFLTEADGKAIGFNRELTESEREARRDRIYAPYHEAIEDALAARAQLEAGPFLLLSVHSFTPVFRGATRSVEIGVLFDEHDELAELFANAIGQQGFACELNQPYSGKPPDGLIYSAGSHGRSKSVPYLELEIRQDLIGTESDAASVAERLEEPLRKLAARLS